MFKPEDLFKIIDYLKGLDVPELDSTVKAIASGDKSKVEQFFKKVIDIPAYSTNDYLMLRSFIIDWYTSIRSLATVARKSTDIYSMTSENIDELFRSFGYPYSSQILSKNQKVALFLDLVDLYKKKGSPQSIFRALQYHGVAKTELAEMWLMRNDAGELVFRGRKLLPEPESLRECSFPEMPFYKATSNDPHWTQTESDIIRLEQSNLIRLPSITPYFGIRTFVSLIEERIAYAIVEREVQDQYQDWQSTGTPPPKSMAVESLGETVSLLEIVLASVEVANRYWGRNPTDGNRFICYNGPNMPPDVMMEEILTEFQDHIGVRCRTRQEVKDWYEFDLDKYSRLQSTNFIQDATSVLPVLTALNPNIVNLINAYEATGKLRSFLIELVTEIDGWIASNISIDYSYLLVQIFGNEMLENLEGVLDFFKPYRARFIDYGTNYLGFEQFLVDDSWKQYITLIFRNDVVCPFWDHDQYFDYRMPLIFDELHLRIHQPFHDIVFHTKSDFDGVGVFDYRAPDDLLEIRVWQYIRDHLQFRDRISISQTLKFIDHVVEDNFDGQLHFDCRFPMIDDFWKIVVRLKFHDRVTESKTGYDYDHEYHDVTSIVDFIQNRIRTKIIEQVQVSDVLLTNLKHTYQYKDYDDTPLNFDEGGEFDVDLSGRHKDFISIIVKNGFSYFYDFTWTLNHNYNTYDLLAECYRSGIKLNSNQIQFVDLNTAEADFPVAQEGNFIVIKSDLVFGQDFSGATYDPVRALYKWEINHNLSTTDVLVTCTDNSRTIIQPVELEITSPNQVVAWFSSNAIGRASVLSSNFANKIYSEIRSGDTILNINHNLHSLRVINRVYDVSSLPYKLLEPVTEEILDEDNIRLLMSGPGNYKVITIRR